MIGLAPPAESAPLIRHVTALDAREELLTVYSPAMARDITVHVHRAAKPGAPVLYLLTGSSGGVDGAQWRTKTDALVFLADKHVNVVSPIGGEFSYYTDWRHPDPRLGVNKWKTFLTAELPPLLNSHLQANGRNAIAGLSMSGTSALALAIAAPGLYRAAASYSGCVQTSDPVGQQFVRLTVETWGLGNTVNMYGPPSDPMWAANDPIVHAAGLRGVALYVSAGNGLPGRYDIYNGAYSLPGPWGMANQLVLGGGIEAATNMCAHYLKQRLDGLGIPATYNFRPNGTHTWGYWQDDLKRSWPVLAGALGI